jgi:hypothetical protein
MSYNSRFSLSPTPSRQQNAVGQWPARSAPRVTASRIQWVVGLQLQITLNVRRCRRASYERRRVPRFTRKLRTSYVHRGQALAQRARSGRRFCYTKAAVADSATRSETRAPASRRTPHAVNVRLRLPGTGLRRARRVHRARGPKESSHLPPARPSEQEVLRWRAALRLQRAQSRVPPDQARQPTPTRSGRLDR